MKIKVIKSDITAIKVDAIVNAANTSLLGGSGVDGAIHRKGGIEILNACKEIRNKQGNCKVGEAVITTAGKLNANYLIHTVGPVWNNGGVEKEILLENCYRNSMLIAIEYDAKSIAFPNISTGIYEFPKELAAKIAIETIKRFQNNDTIEEVIFVCFDDKNYLIYFHLSVLSGLIIPMGNIILPFILWITKKDKIIDLKDVGANLLNFQIVWTFFASTALIIGAFLKITHIEIGPFSSFTFPIYSWAILYVINIIFPIVFAIKIKNGKTKGFYPNIIKLIK